MFFHLSTVTFVLCALRRCLYTFESAKDYVYDVQWSPIHPSLFVSGDGTGFVDFWDLNKDTEVPIHHVNVLGMPYLASLLRQTITGAVAFASLGCPQAHALNSFLSCTGPLLTVPFTCDM